MKPWFGPQAGSNAGYHGVWMSYSTMPTSWQGCLVLLVYLVLQFGCLFATWKAVFMFGRVGLVGLVGMAILWVIYNRLASRHYATRAETDPTTLPADERK
jgi:hypothetical protein